jgi:hypothetical protein
MSWVTVAHEYECDVDTFWDVFFDEEHIRALYTEGLRFPKFEILELRRGEYEIVRRIAATPRLNAPEPIVSALGPKLSFVEEGVFDKATKVYRSRSITTILPDLMRYESQMTVEPLEGARCKRIAKFEFEAKMLGIGGLIVSGLEKGMRSEWDRATAFTNEWMAKHPRASMLRSHDT